MDSNSVIVIKEASNMITTFWPAIIGSLITGGSILLTAYFAYRFGLQTYFKKREHEQIIKRYLDEGADHVLAAVDQASRVFIDNYLTAEIILGRVQEGKVVDTPVKFQRFDRHILELTPYHKIAHLVGDDTFWGVIQRLFGFIDAESVFLNGEFWPKLVDIGLEQVPGDPILKKMENHLDISYQKFEGYSLLPRELRQITFVLEKQTTLNWANLAQFRDRPEVRASVKRLKERFGPELQKRRQKQKQ